MRIIPEELNKKLKKEYTLRFFVLFFIMITIVHFLVLTFLSSSYVLLHLYQKAYVVENNGYGDQVVVLKNKINTQIKNLYQISNKIPEENSASNALVISEKIFSYAGSQITIQSLEIMDQNTITLRALASSRDSLLLFESKIKNDTDFKGFSIPIDALARQQDINFSVTFTYDQN